MTFRITAILMALCGLVLIGWDIWAAWNRERNDTITEITRHYGWRTPILMVACGVVIGHLFIPANRASKWIFETCYEKPWLAVSIGVIVSFLWQGKR
jgi:hypothetical protein